MRSEKVKLCPPPSSSHCIQWALSTLEGQLTEIMNKLTCLVFQVPKPYFTHTSFKKKKKTNFLSVKHIDQEKKKKEENYNTPKDKISK